MTIEDIIDFDKNNLTDYKLIYSKMGKAWYWFYGIASFLTIMTIIFALCMIAFIKNPDFKWLLLCIPAIFALLILVRIFRKKTAPILKEYNNKFNLNLKTDLRFFNDRKIISRIQYLVLADFINSNNIKPTKEDLSKIIEALKFESESTRYNYQSLTIIIAFLTILTSAFLGSWLHISNNIDDLIKIATKCTILLILLSFAIFHFEEYIVKDIIRGRRNRYQRLIRALENYSLNFKV